MLLESEARDARQAWLPAMDCNRVVHAELLAYRAKGHDMTKEPEPQDRPTNAGNSCQTWMTFGGNTYDLGPLREETDEITDLHHILEEVLLTERGDDVASIKQRCRNLFSDDVWNLETASGSGQLKKDLESATSRINIIPLSLFKKLNIRLLEETDHIFGLADETKSYPVGILKDVEVHIENLKLLNDLYVIDMKKDPEAPLLVGRGFLATANVVIVCRMAKIVVGEGITGSVFEVKVVDLGEEEAPYWTTLEKRNHTNHDLARMDTWMEFGENTLDLGSFAEETDRITDLHQILEEVLLTEHGDDVASIKRRRRGLFSDIVWNLETMLGRGRLKEDLESSKATTSGP
nr:hypothetical protein [Tanacetum cinerariifolium]